MLDQTHPLAELLRRDKRYPFEAYRFVFEALRYAQQELKLGLPKHAEEATQSGDGDTGACEFSEDDASTSSDSGDASQNDPFLGPESDEAALESSELAEEDILEDDEFEEDGFDGGDFEEAFDDDLDGSNYSGFDEATFEEDEFDDDELESVLEEAEIDEVIEPEEHVTGQQLCEAIRLYAIEQFGLMAKTVLEHWGIRATGDFGEIVFNLIDIGQMRKTPSDRREDFDDVYDFAEAFDQRFSFTLPPPGKERSS